MKRLFQILFTGYLVLSLALGFCDTYLSFSLTVIILYVSIFVYNKQHRWISIPHKAIGSRKCTIPTESLNAYKSLFLYFTIVFTLFLMYWLAYYPGGFNLDAYGQWLQAHGLMQYNDWHPFTSTLIIQLFLCVHDSFAFYIFSQIVLSTIAISFLLYSIQIAGVNHKLLIALAIYIGINPVVAMNTICMTKDVQFTIFSILFTACSIRILSTNALWLNSWQHLSGFSIVSIMMILVRHNGILFVITAFICLLALYKPYRRKISSAALLIFMVCFFVKGPVAFLLQVEPHENILGEISGIPMGMMGNALTIDQVHLPESVQEFLYQIADKELWYQYYLTGEWDSCKWIFGGTEVLKNNTIFDVLIHTISTIVHCPQACYESFQENTKMVWSLFGSQINWMPYVYIEPNEFNIVESAFPFFHTITNYIISLMQLPILSSFFWHPGFLLAIALGIWLIIRQQHFQKNVLLLAPIFVYTVGAMFLLSSPNIRYIYFIMVLIPPIILYMSFQVCVQFMEE